MKKFENTFRGSLSLEGAVSHFYDYLSNQLDAYLEDTSERYDHSKNVYFAESKFGEGSSFEIEVWYDENEDEWKCLAY